MIDVAVNTYAMSRGVSGSRTGLANVLRALGEDPTLSVTEHPGPALHGPRVQRLASWAWWDLRGIHDAIDGRAVLVSGCNVGVATREHPNVLLMHDTMVLDHPESFDPGYVAYAKAVFGISARRSTLVVAPSRDSAARIARRFDLRQVPTVVPWPFVGRLEEPTTDLIEARFARPVVTVVGASEQHKRLPTAVMAVRLLRQLTGLEIELAIVGPPGRGEDELTRLVDTFDPERRWIRRYEGLTDCELVEQYRLSWLVMQTSIDEGFGLPVLEACGRGTPVLHTGRGALSEVHPAGSVSSTAPEAFVECALELLDRTAYQQASAAATASARRHDWGTFAASWGRLVELAWARP